jgi:hypothetical protein
VLAVGGRADLAVWDLDPQLLEPASGLPRLAIGDPLPACVATLGGGRVLHVDAATLGKLPACHPR